MSTPTSLIVKHTFPYPAERVFDAWVDIERARNFFFATESGTLTRADVDARVGGEFVIVDRRNGEDFTHSGQYLEVDRPRHLKFAFAVNGSPETIVAIDIAPTNSGCELTLSHEGVPETFRERSAKGWKTVLERAAELV